MVPLTQTRNTRLHPPTPRKSVLEQIESRKHSTHRACNQASNYTQHLKPSRATCPISSVSPTMILILLRSMCAIMPAGLVVVLSIHGLMLQQLGRGRSHTLEVAMHLWIVGRE